MLCAGLLFLCILRDFTAGLAVVLKECFLSTAAEN